MSCEDLEAEIKKYESRMQRYINRYYSQDIYKEENKRNEERLTEEMVLEACDDKFLFGLDTQFMESYLLERIKRNKNDN